MVCAYALLVMKYFNYHPCHGEISIQLRHYLEMALPVRGLQ